MKVDFNFGATAEITLTPESPKEEALVKMCYEIAQFPVLSRTGENKIKIEFASWMNLSSGPVCTPKPISLTLGEAMKEQVI